MNSIVQINVFVVLQLLYTIQHKNVDQWNIKLAPFILETIDHQYINMCHKLSLLNIKSLWAIFSESSTNKNVFPSILCFIS